MLRKCRIFPPVEDGRNSKDIISEEDFPVLNLSMKYEPIPYAEELVDQIN